MNIVGCVVSEYQSDLGKGQEGSIALPQRNASLFVFVALF